MSLKFWFLRATKVFTVVFLLLWAVYYFKDYETYHAILAAAIWSFIATSVFICTRLYHSKNGNSCSICNDTPEKSSTDTK
ncbi:hypothetical protein [Parashewanella tropica]|uniref:hypothetical protein n=1 Tax=Parashewanella tropica TaxID=2547970 RepID=UPI0010594EE3|nr:hypothetical protein [Parashewanella tropica]